MSIITSFHYFHRYGNKCFSSKIQNHCVAFVTRVNFVCVQTRTAYAVFTRVKMQFPCFIEGLHNSVRSHTRMIWPCSLVSFFYSAVWRKTTKHVIILDSLYHVYYRISNFTQVCGFCHSVVVWYYDII